MSNYNSQLQSNNADLQGVLELLQTKATGGVVLPTLTNEGTAADLLSGKQLIDQNGNIVTGTIATKTSSNLTASGKTVTVPAGYYASQATKSISTATQATPSINIDSAGKITASATQSAGYVSAGTKSATKQLTVQAAKTITPSESSQTAVASGRYTTGTVTVAAIPDEYMVGDEINAQKNSISQILSILTTKGYTAVNTITFTIDGKQYQADEGMTWSEWIDSQYNTDGGYINNDFIIIDGCHITKGNFDFVNIADVIINSFEYIGILPPDDE